MRHIRGFLARIAGFFNGHREDDDLRAEMQAHLDMETAEYIRRGMDPGAARRQALVASGGLTQAAEAVYAQRGLPWLESVGADIRYAFRALRHSPAFTAVVVVTLALGIGANTAIFSVIRGVVLKPLPHRSGDRLVYLRQSADGPGQENLNFSVPEVRDLRSGAPSFGGIAEYSSWSTVHETSDGPARIRVGLVSGNYFEVMGLSPVLGRLTQPGDDGKVAPAVAVLTYEYWLARFGGDSGVVGKMIILDRKPVTVIGVLQRAPFFPNRVEALLNMVNSEHHMGASMQSDRSHRMTEVVARLRTGATLDQARAEIATITSRQQNQFKDSYDPGAHYGVAVIPFKRVFGERAQLTLWLLIASAAFVLIISAANVANLTLMRGVRREQELVVRAALGAGVGRLRRLLLVENLVLAVMGAVVGIAIAVNSVSLLTSLAARYSTRANEIRLDGVVLSFALGLSVAVALLLSFLASLPKEGSFASKIVGASRMSGSLRKQRLQRGLVVVQVAVSVMLLAGAGLLTRTMLRLSEVDTGLESEEVLTMNVNLLTRAERLSNPAAVDAARARYDRMIQQLGALPGVVDVGRGSAPLQYSELVREVIAEGRTVATGEAMPRGELRFADPNYFDAVGIPLLQGQSFSARDGDGLGNVFAGRGSNGMSVIINRTLADMLFRGSDPIGKRIAWTDGIRPVFGEWSTVIGVVGNTQDGGLDAKPRGAVFIPTDLSEGLVIHADRNVAALKSAATRVVREIAPTALIEDVLTVAQIKDQSVSPRRLNAALISSFGILAVIIAAVGIAGVLAFSVSARTNEIGVRMSLGADRGRVQRMILQEGGALLAVGLVFGVVGSLVFARVIRGLLFGVEPYDPVTLLSVAAVMATVGLLACWLPAIRASRIDPAVTMRS